MLIQQRFINKFPNNQKSLELETVFIIKLFRKLFNIMNTNYIFAVRRFLSLKGFENIPSLRKFSLKTFDYRYVKFSSQIINFKEFDDRSDHKVDSQKTIIF